MKIHFECKYCGKQWRDVFYSEASIKNQRCRYCDDKNLKVRDLTDSRIDYYVGCPPFPSEVEKIEDNYHMWGE